MFENELFKEQESAFMRDFLPHLHQSFPCIFGSEFRTIGALHVLNEVFNFESLFQDR